LSETYTHNVGIPWTKMPFSLLPFPTTLAHRKWAPFQVVRPGKPLEVQPLDDCLTWPIWKTLHSTPWSPGHQLLLTEKLEPSLILQHPGTSSQKFI
jgi:hypothetical protein